jgi:quercetin dioxygenase-like cupin family protein
MSETRITISADHGNALSENELALVGVEVEHFFMGGMYAKKMKINAGSSIGQHIHEHDHCSTLCAGEVDLVVDGVPWRFTAPASLLLRGGRSHIVRAVTDAVWFCLWPTEETDFAKVDSAILGG